MTLDKRARKQMFAHCNEIHDDDGVDPREFFKSGKFRKKTSHKGAQLCAQVAETLSLVLSGEFDDELLHNLQVIAVDPAPDASQLVVTLRADLSAGTAGVEEVQQRLAAISGRLRCEIAATITRKRAPRLVFHVIGPLAAGPGETAEVPL